MLTFSPNRLAVNSVRRNVSVRSTSTALPSKFSKVSPSGERVLVKLETPEQKTSSGILLPSSSEVDKNEGIVVSVGTGSNVKEGSHVLFAQYAGCKVTVGDEAHVIMGEKDVLGVKGASMADLQPTEDRVLIRIAAEESASVGGVILTSQSSDKPTIGEVVAVGPGSKGEDDKVKEVNCKAGQQVMYSKYSGIELEEGDDAFVVVREPEILAVLS